MTITRTPALPAPQEEPPVTDADLRQWAAGVPPEDAAVALVAAGLDDERWPEYAAAVRAGNPRGGPGLVPWRIDADTLRRTVPVPGPDVAFLREASAPPGAPLGARPPLRLVVSGNLVPPEVLPWLLRVPGVDSAMLPVQRPPGALRRRPWRWPLRIGVLTAGSVPAGPDLVDPDRIAPDPVDVAAIAAVIRARHSLPAALVDVRDVHLEPAAVDLLVVTGSLEDTVAAMTASRQVANAVVVMGPAQSAWPVDDARLALVRATSAAVLAALVRPTGTPPALAVSPGGSTSLPPATPAAHLAGALEQVLVELSHGWPLDVALTRGFGPSTLLTAEPAAVEATGLPAIGRTMATQVRRTAARMAPEPPPDVPRSWRGAHPGWTERPGFDTPPVAAEPPPPPPGRWTDETPPPPLDALEAAAGELDAISDGLFMGESHEASRIGPVLDRVEAALDAAVPVRLLQCTVGNDNVFRRGANAVGVFIGPQAVGALAAGPVTDEELGFDQPDVTSVRLTVVLVPQRPTGPPSRAELDVPRAGTSSAVEFVLSVGPEDEQVSARLIVLHRNRVLQTAVLAGPVGGEPASLRELAVVRRDLAHLDDRRPFDVALVANHDDTGMAALTAHCDGYTTVAALDELGPTTERLRTLLVVPSAKLSKEALRKLLVQLAVQGHDLYLQLSAYLSTLPDAERIQVVTARSSWFLPLELAYARRAPDDDAKLCPNWVDGGDRCGPSCGTGMDDPTIVCPAAFWGMSKTIERHYLDQALPELGAQFLLIAEPRANARTLSAGRALLGASSKVTTTSIKETLKSLGDGVQAEAGWQAWADALKDTGRDLLVLMPHADTKAATLEIAKKTLDRGRIHPDYVTGGHQVRPIVLLFGCDTAGSLDDPAGYATRFMQCGAATVLTSLTMLRASHAADLASRLCTMLRDSGRSTMPVAELIMRFRRAAVRAGQPVALAITAQGDADWTV